MQFTALATDYDGTLAHHGTVDDVTMSALLRLKASGRKLLMVTGRQLEELRTVFAHIPTFDLVVAENGALLYDPSNATKRLLCPPVPAELVEALRALDVPISVGHAIAATVEPHEPAVRRAIAMTGAAVDIVLNKGSIMLLPTGVNKATGLTHAVQRLGVALEQVVGIGDAENDIDFLRACGLGVAVGNALPSVKAEADLVTTGCHGAGVAEFIDRWLRGDVLPRRSRTGAALPR